MTKFMTSRFPTKQETKTNKKLSTMSKFMITNKSSMNNIRKMRKKSNTLSKERA